MTLRGLLAAAAILALSSNADAAQIIYNVQGVVDSINLDTANVVQGRIVSGSLFEATFTFDSNRTDDSPANPHYAGYYGPGTATLKIGTMPLISTTLSSEIDVFVVDNPDEYQVLATALNLPGPANSVAVDVKFAIDLISFLNPSALTSDALLPDLPNFDSFEKKAFGMLGIWTVDGVTVQTAVEGHLTSAVVSIPEPMTAAIMAVGIAALLSTRRRHI